jgi:hypothetical protein
LAGAWNDGSRPDGRSSEGHTSFSPAFEADAAVWETVASATTAASRASLRGSPSKNVMSCASEAWRRISSTESLRRRPGPRSRVRRGVPCQRTCRDRYLGYAASGPPGRR